MRHVHSDLDTGFKTTIVSNSIPIPASAEPPQKSKVAKLTEFRTPDAYAHRKSSVDDSR